MAEYIDGEEQLRASHARLKRLSKVLPVDQDVLKYDAVLDEWRPAAGGGGGMEVHGNEYHDPDFSVEGHEHQLQAHASSHKHGGSDEIATATPAANAIPKAGASGNLALGWIPDALTGKDADTLDTKHYSDISSEIDSDIATHEAAPDPHAGYLLADGTRIAAKMQIDDAQFVLDLVDNKPKIIFDANDFLIYDRTTDRLDFYIGGTQQATINTAGLLVPRLQVDDANTYLDKDAANNLTFTDAVTGTKTLAELAAGGGGGGDPDAELLAWLGGGIP